MAPLIILVTVTLLLRLVGQLAIVGLRDSNHSNMFTGLVVKSSKVRGCGTEGQLPFTSAEGPT